MQMTTYYVAQRFAGDAEASALLHLINDTCCGNGDNRNWNTLRAQVDALLDADTQRRLGVFIQAEQCEAPED